MDENKARNGRQEGADFSPAWPQRPDRKVPDPARPRLDPPEARRSEQETQKPGTGQTNSAPSKWTSHPTSHNLNGYPVDDPKSTRVLPVQNGKSRFDNGRPRQHGQQPYTPPTAPQPQPARKQAQPAPDEARGASRPGQGQSPAPREAQAGGQQGRNAGGPRYEHEGNYRTGNTSGNTNESGYDGRNDYNAYDGYGGRGGYGGYDGYEDRTAVYQPVARPQGKGAAQGRQIPRAKAYPTGKVETGKSYLSVEVEGEKPRRGLWVVWGILAVIGIVLIGGIAFGLAWQGQYAGKLYAGVSIMGTNLGGKTPDEAKKILKDRVKAFTTEPVVLAWRGKEWRPSLDDLGVQMSIDSTVDEAFSVGRSADFFDNVAQQWGAAQMGYVVPLTVQVNEPKMQEYLDTVAQGEINQELFEGDVRLNGSEIEAKPGAEGRTLNTYAAIQAIKGSIASLEAGKKIDLPVTIVQPTVSAEEVRDVESLLAIRVSGPVTATTLTGTLTIDRDALVRFTTIERNPDRSAKRHIQLGWKDNELKILADKWVAQANRAAQNARFAWNNGQLAVMTESIDGFETDEAAVLKAIKENADTTDRRTFELPGKVITPTVSSKDLPALGIKELMGTGTSTFKGSSQERATNIQVAANLLNGAVVPPGGTFSFLKQMGGIDEAHGFVEGYVIAAERTQLGVGGGVCQVSTTMFRAAFWSGLQITERNQHSYRVSWYEANGEPVGFDAAVFDPGVDLAFVNTTPNYVLVEAKVADSLITVNVYGTKIPGEVKLEGPVITNRQPPPPDVYEVDTRLPPGTKKQVETAHAGLNTKITRRIVVPGQPDKIDEFNSAYQPWPNWFIVASPAQIPGGGQPAPRPTPNP